MKKLLLITILFLISGCSQKISFTFDPEESGIQSRVPVQVIWYKKVKFNGSWSPYKEVNQHQAKDMRNLILELLQNQKSYIATNNSDNKLSILFYNGLPERLTVREIFFDPKTSEKITGFFVQEKINSTYYYPYEELSPDHYTEWFERLYDKKELPVVGKN